MAAKKQEKSIQAGKAMQARRKPCLFVRILEVLLLLLLLAILGGVLLLQKGYLGKEDLMQNPVAEKVHAATHSYAVSISEILPGDGVYPNGDGEICGWVELYNAGEKAEDLSGWALCSHGKTYTLPEGQVLESGAYLVIYCSKTEGTLLYTGFSLRPGDVVTLKDPEGYTQEELELPANGGELSYVCGAEGLVPAQALSPGFENTAAGAEQYLASLGWRTAPVVVTEAMLSNKTGLRDSYGNFSDWLEFENISGETVNLEGFRLSDDPEDPAKCRLPAKTLAPGERVVVFCSGQESTEEELHVGFSLNAEGETLYLSSPIGIALSETILPAAETDIALQLENGAVVGTTRYATPGYENSESGYEAYIAAHDQHGALVINEAVLYNSDYAPQNNETYDWVELKNVSQETIQLSDYALSDKAGEEGRFSLPDRTLEPGQTVVIFCSGNESLSNGNNIHAPFALSSKGERLYLFEKNGSICDVVSLQGIPRGGSMGRMENGSGFYYFSNRTPGAENGWGLRYVTEAPMTTPAQGLYNDVEQLEIGFTGSGSIYYTTDGSVPTENSALYTGPLKISSTTILRAICVEEGKITGEPATFSYFLNEGHTLPVVSLVGDPTEVNKVYSYTWAQDLEVDANVTFFDGDSGFSSDCGLRLHGATSRTAWAKKSLKLVFRGMYGGDIDYDVFGTGDGQTYHSLLLRAGDLSGLHIIRDELAAETAMAVLDDSYALDTRYCVLYINGKYYGIYAWREAYSTKFLADESGSSEESVVISRAPARRGELKQLFDYIMNHNMADEGSFSYVEERLDLYSLANWMAVEAYFNNMDVPGNVRYFRGDNTDGKWKLCLFDFDIAMTNNFSGWGNVFDIKNQIGAVCSSMIRSPKFREILLECTSNLYKKGLDTELVQQIFDELVEPLTDEEAARDLARWSPKTSIETWHSKLEWQKTRFCYSRTANWLRTLKNCISASDEEMTRWFGEDYPKL